VSGFFFLAGSILATNLARNTDPGARLKLVDWTHIHEAYERHRHTDFRTMRDSMQGIANSSSQPGSTGAGWRSGPIPEIGALRLSKLLKESRE
jgi:hypothetical protein